MKVQQSTTLQLFAEDPPRIEVSTVVGDLSIALRTWVHTWDHTRDRGEITDSSGTELRLFGPAETVLELLRTMVLQAELAVAAARVPAESVGGRE